MCIASCNDRCRCTGMQEVVRNLGIHHIEFKDESDPEISEHTFAKVRACESLRVSHTRCDSHSVGGWGRLFIGYSINTEAA